MYVTTVGFKVWSLTVWRHFYKVLHEPLLFQLKWPDGKPADGQF